MKIVGLVSSYNEGELLAGAIRSLQSVGIPAVVFEGPTSDDQPPSPDISPPGPKHVRVVYRIGRWESDGAKRTAMVAWVQTRLPDTRWALWLDADEILLHGEQLPNYLRRIEADTSGRGIGFKFPIRIVELDGSVALCHGKVIRVDQVAAYHRSTTDVEFKWSPVIQVLGNEPNWLPARLGPDGEIVEQQWAQTPLQRPPLQGEPHLLHLSALRAPDRARLRLHEAEAQAWERMKQASGLSGVD